MIHRRNHRLRRAARIRFLHHLHQHGRDVLVRGTDRDAVQLWFGGLRISTN